MIGIPFNDLRCLGAITEEIATRVQQQDRQQQAAIEQNRVDEQNRSQAAATEQQVQQQ